MEGGKWRRAEVLENEGGVCAHLAIPLLSSIQVASSWSAQKEQIPALLVAKYTDTDFRKQCVYV